MIAQKRESLPARAKFCIFSEATSPSAVNAGRDGEQQVTDRVVTCVFFRRVHFCTMVHSFPQGNFQISLANKKHAV